MVDRNPTENRPLFRAKAVEHFGSQRHGSILLARLPSHWFLTILFVGIAILIVAFFTLFSYHRKVQVSGVLLPESGLIRVMSTQVGIVVERNAREGQVVKAGDPLFVLASERATATQGNAEKAISSLLQRRLESLVMERGQLRRQSAQRMEAASRRADDLAGDVGRIESQIVLQRRRVALAEESLKRSTDLQSQNFVSSAQVQDRQGELLDQQQRLGDLARAKSSMSRDLATVQADLRDQRIQAQRDQEGAERGISSIEQQLTENEARRQIIVRSPHDGALTAVNAELGQSVSANQALASVLPIGSPLIAEIYAPSRAAGFLKPGMDVLVRYQAYPYQKFGQHLGKIREVSNTAMRPEEMTLPGAAQVAGATSEPLYRVRVSLERQAVSAYGNEQPLRSGMALDASVMLERRRLYEWALEPLYTVTGRL